MTRRVLVFLSLSALLLCLAVVAPRAQTAAPPVGLQGQVDQIAHDVLEATGVPSASVAVVSGDALVYAQGYGKARLSPALAAVPTMRYSIGSVSKQFAASCILLLEEQGKLSLDDPVGRYVPGLTRGNEVTIREILSHTSGYQDFWPQDYVPPAMMKPITPEQILDGWARRPLDFDPGTKWQYSNTNFTIAGLIVEKASGMPFWNFLEQHILQPLGLKSAVDSDGRPIPADQPSGYFRYALGPARPAPVTGRGWGFAAFELAMTSSDLAKWNLSIINESLLKPSSYRELETEVRLKNGLGTHYGLGLEVLSLDGHRELEHSGETSGFTSENIVLPDDKMAVTVLTNQDAASAASQIGQRVTRARLRHDSPTDQRQAALARKVFDDLRAGKIDRSLFTPNANAYFTNQAVQDYAESLSPLGEIESFVPTAVQGRGGMIYRGFLVTFATKTVSVSIYEMPDGKFEQYLIASRD
jgi:CubicO group peptidase (beta-lactamase class C family)